MKKYRVLAALLLLLTGVVSAVSVHASSYTLTDGNSTARIDPFSQAGVYSWVVDGKQVMWQQWFWYRIGGTGGETSLDAIGPPTVTQVGLGSVQMEYTASNFKVDITYDLWGGAAKSGASVLEDNLTITNLTSNPLQIHLFQYSDLDLTKGIQKDSAVLSSPGFVTQSGQAVVSNSVGFPGPNHWQISYYDTFPNLLDKLNDGSPTTLTDSNGTVINGDISWAFEWDMNVAGLGHSGIVNSTGVPEPGILLLLGSGLIGALAIRKKLGKRLRSGEDR